MESALRHGLSDREFELFYQPQIDITSGRLAGLEALIRWHRPGNGLVRPDVFIGAAEDGPVRFHYPGPTVEEDFGTEAAR